MGAMMALKSGIQRARVTALTGLLPLCWCWCIAIGSEPQLKLNLDPGEFADLR